MSCMCKALLLSIILSAEKDKASHDGRPVWMRTLLTTAAEWLSMVPQVHNCFTHYCPFMLTLPLEVNCNCTVRMTIRSIVCLYFAYGTYSYWARVEPRGAYPRKSKLNMYRRTNEVVAILELVNVKEHEWV